jgi:hypothetical protein
MAVETQILSIKNNAFDKFHCSKWIVFMFIWIINLFPVSGFSQDGQKQDHPSLWKGKNIGEVKKTGSFSGYDEGSWFNYTLKSSGNGVGSTGDSFYYMYREYSGDFTIETPLNALTGGQAGLMIRTALEPNSPNLALLIKDNEAALQWRAKPGEDTKRNTLKSTLSGFLKIIRSANTFHTYVSEDNKNWYRVGDSQTLNFSNTTYVGLAVSAKGIVGEASAVFGGVSIKPSAKLPGKPKERDKSQDWLNKDIGINGGKVTMAKGALMESYTITTSNNGINPASGKFHFMYKKFNGDFTFLARLTSQTNGEAGLMVKESLQEKSKMVSLLIKNAAAYFQSQNGNTVEPNGNIKNAGVSPYLKLTRSGNTFEASLLSKDGKQWIKIGSALQMDLDKAIYIGIAAGPGSEQKSTEAIFTNLALSNEAALPKEKKVPGFKLNADFRTTVKLNGEWDLQEANGEAKPVFYTRSVPVPGITTMAHPAYVERLHMNRITTREMGDETVADEMVSSPFKYFWYKKTFLIEGSPKERVSIKVRAKYNAQVYLNGILLGYDKHSTYTFGEFDATKAIRYGKENVLEIRVGCNETATFSSIMTVSNHYRSSRAPGIWDDVILEFSQAQYIQEVLITPDIYTKTAKAKVAIANKEAVKRSVILLAQVVDSTGKVVSPVIEKKVDLLPNSQKETVMLVPCKDISYWMGGKYGNPALYKLEIKLLSTNKKSDAISETFGFRNIEVSGRDFKINGKKTYFHNENIVFERALIDWAPLLFDESFARKFLTAIKNEYNIDLLRFHVAHAPSMWYKIADEVGVMIFDEWKFFHENDPLPGMQTEDNTIEFERWMKQNMNHPSIIGWKNQNEGHTEIEEIIAKCKAIDGSRPWTENQEVIGDNRYYYVEMPENYSGKPQLDDKRYEETFPGKPYLIFESIRWWSDNHTGWPERKVHISNAKKWFKNENYTPAMSDTIQQMLFADEGGYYRTIPEVSAWCPFALLSGSVNGHTLFEGDLQDLKPRKSLLVLRDLNEHFGATIRMLNAIEWFYDKKKYAKGELITKPVDVWNHFDHTKSGTIFCRVYGKDGKTALSENSFKVSVPAYGTTSQNIGFQMPGVAGDYILKCEIKDENGVVSWSPERYVRVR